MNKISEQQIKDLLFKEAQTKREKYKDTFIKDFLFTETEKSLSKNAQLDHQLPIEIEPELPQPKKNKETIPSELLHVRKKNNKNKRLFKDRSQYASIEERLQKAANKLDKLGEIRVADKIDQLLTMIRNKK